MRATNLDQVINGLMCITDRAIRDKSRMGYFSALYMRVTAAVKRGVESGLFRDGDLMARMDVNFANRYFDAVEKHQAGQPIPDAWRVAFDACEREQPTVLQHLYLGLNAHLLLDLGISAAETCPGPELSTLHDDFLRINDVVGSLMRTVNRDVGRASPWIGMFEKYAGGAWALGSQAIMNMVRDRAWHAARELAPLGCEAQKPIIKRLDREAARNGRRIMEPGFAFASLVRSVRSRELPDVSLVIQRLLGE